ncbi:MAG: 3'-5' exoribonuclease [Candidatus Micrarchaeaceae archaeon]|jgi:hypothetical protein
MIVLDIETTGEIPWEHSILSIGAIEFSNPSNQFYNECRIREGAKIDPEALNINGFSRKEIENQDKKSLKDALTEFIEWTEKIDDTTIAGLNHYMDVYFLEFSLNFYGMKSPFKYRLVDLHTIAYVNHLNRGLELPLESRGSALKSNIIYKYCGMPVEEFPHNALTGAKMEAEAFSRFIYGKNLLTEYKEFEIPDYLKK